MDTGSSAENLVSVLEKFIVYQGDEPALFPGLTKTSTGDLLISFCTRFDCIAGGKAYVIRSSDGGRTWTPPELVAHSSKPNGCINLSVGLATLHDGTILFPCCDATITRQWDQHDAHLMILRSADGRTWNHHTPIAVPVKEPFAYGRIVELRDGTLLCPIWGKRIPEEAWRSGLLQSRDGGLTWGDYVTIAYDAGARARTDPNDPDIVHCAGFNETTVVELPSGHLLAVLRQQGIGPHVRQLFQSRSFDRGLTWTPARPLPLWGTSPSLHLTASGALLLGYRNHLANPQGLVEPGVGLSVSMDDGETWTQHRLLEDPNGYQYQHEFEAGYPAFLELDRTRTLVVFYSYAPELPGERYLAANVLLYPSPVRTNG